MSVSPCHMPLSHIVEYLTKFDRSSALMGQGEILLEMNRQLTLWWGSEAIKMKVLMTKGWNVLGRGRHIYRLPIYLDGELAMS